MSNNIVLPGLIDIHVHLRTPGQTYKEDFLTGTSAAIAGGFTTILDMPNNITPIKTAELLNEKIKLAKKDTRINIGFFIGSQGENLDEFENVRRDVFGIKLYLNETTGNFLINSHVLSRIFDAWNGGPILVHAEDDAVVEVIKNVKRTKKPTHFCHISLQSDLEQIEKAKEMDLPITCGVTPHHLFLSQDDAQKLGPYGKMKPYLKSQKDVDFLWKNLKKIDVIESDHAPHTKEEKESENPPFGVPGLETTLPLLFTAVHNGKLTIQDIQRLCYDNPLKIFHIPKTSSTIEIDPDEEYVIKNENLYTKCKWTPFNGFSVTGRLKKVIIDNKVAFENGKITAELGSGRVIKPAL